jgi:ribose transport system substrate-binding protein
MHMPRRSKAISCFAVLTAAVLALSGCAKSEDAGSGGDTSAAVSSGAGSSAPTDSSAGAESPAAGSDSAGSESAAGSDSAASGEGSASSGGSDSTEGADSSGGAQVVESGEGGETCTIEQYGLEPFDLKSATVGFSQSEKEDNPFRIAETQSIKDEAKKLGIKLETTNAQTDLNKQISDIQDLLNKGVKLLIVAPLNSDGLEPAFQAAKDKGVPIITIDRKVNMTACKDYVSFLGSNFVQQGKRAATQMIKATGGKGKIAILLGSAGNNVTDDRTKGFVDEIKASAPDIEIVAQQSGDFARDKGQQVTEQLIQAHPDITGIYAENDEMGIGAVNALEAAGKKPGEKIKMVTVDGTKNAVQLIVDGKYNAVIESNPRFGPLAFKTAEAFASGQPVGQNVIISDTEYNADNAKAKVGTAF